MQYVFVGFAMCMFYLLLVSISEHIGFDAAYAGAATVTILLIATYSVFGTGWVLGRGGDWNSPWGRLRLSVLLRL